MRRDPLEGLLPPVRGPALVHAALILLAFALIQPLFLHVFTQAGGSGATPGSHVWHCLQLADAVARIAFCGAMAWIILQTSGPRNLAVTVSVGKLIVVTLAIFPALLAVCLAQAAFVTELWGWFDPKFQAPQHDLLTAFTRSEWGGWGRFQLTTVAVVVAPIAEELFFRGILFPAIWRLTGLVWPAIALSAAFFALVHAAYPQTVLPMLTFGILLGALRAKTGNLAACALLHALFNGRTMLLAVLHPEILTVPGS